MWRATVLVMAVAAAACTASRPPLETVAGHDDVPLYPGSSFVPPTSQEGSVTSYAYTLPADATLDKVAGFYRREMPARRWRLTSDQGSLLGFDKGTVEVFVRVSDAKQPATLVVRVSLTTSPTGPAPGLSPGATTRPPTAPVPGLSPGATTRPAPTPTLLPTTTR